MENNTGASVIQSNNPLLNINDNYSTSYILIGKTFSEPMDQLHRDENEPANAEYISQGFNVNCVYNEIPQTGNFNFKYFPIGGEKIQTSFQSSCNSVDDYNKCPPVYNNNNNNGIIMRTDRNSANVSELHVVPDQIYYGNVPNCNFRNVQDEDLDLGHAYCDVLKGDIAVSQEVCIPTTGHVCATHTNRNGATERERNRMHALNQGFEALRRVVPRGTNMSEHQRLSKIATLRLAIQYLGALSGVLTRAGVDTRVHVEEGTCKRRRLRRNCGIYKASQYVPNLKKGE